MWTPIDENMAYNSNQHASSVGLQTIVEYPQPLGLMLTESSSHRKLLRGVPALLREENYLLTHVQRLILSGP